MSLTPSPKTFAELDERVSSGLPKAALRAIVARLAQHNEQATAILYRVNLSCLRGGEFIHFIVDNSDNLLSRLRGGERRLQQWRRPAGLLSRLRGGEQS